MAVLNDLAGQTAAGASGLRIMQGNCFEIKDYVLEHVILLATTILLD